MPAEFTSMSIGPSVRATSAAQRWISLTLRTSATNDCADPPASRISFVTRSARARSRLATTATLAPSRAKRTAIARPIPDLPPKMSATLSLSFISRRPAFAQLQLLDHLLTHQELLNLSGHRGGKLLHETYVSRHLVMRDVSPAKGANFLFARGRTRLEAKPRADLFAILLVGHADDLHFLHDRMRVEKLFDFARIDILAAANDHVLQTSHDIDVAVLIHDRKIAGAHPPVRVYRLTRSHFVVPVAAHHRVPVRA